MNSDKTEGKMDKAKGNVKEAAGSAVGNESLEAEGKADQQKGKLKEAVGNVKEAASDALDSMKKKLND